MIVPYLPLVPAKSLYLPHGRGWTVSLDGPVLRIDAANRAVQFAPLRRVARVVSSTDTCWQTKALLACLKAGIPVIFVDGDGRAQGYCHGRQRRETALAGLLTEAIEHPEWTQRYGDWLHAMHDRLIRQALTVAQVRISFRSHAGARSKLYSAWHQRCGYIVTSLLCRIDGFMYPLVVDHLKSAVGASRFMGHPRQGICLVNDLTALLCWSSYGLLDGLKKDDFMKTTEHRLAAQIVEQNCDRLADQLSKLVDALELWLREWMHEVGQ